MVVHEGGLSKAVGRPAATVTGGCRSRSARPSPAAPRAPPPGEVGGFPNIKTTVRPDSGWGLVHGQREEVVQTLLSAVIHTAGGVDVTGQAGERCRNAGAPWEIR